MIDRKLIAFSATFVAMAAPICGVAFVIDPVPGFLAIGISLFVLGCVLWLLGNLKRSTSAH